MPLRDAAGASSAAPGLLKGIDAFGCLPTNCAAAATVSAAGLARPHLLAVWADGAVPMSEKPWRVSESLHPWFAWHPVELGALGGRWTWLRWVWRVDVWPRIYHRMTAEERRLAWKDRDRDNDIGHLAIYVAVLAVLLAAHVAWHP